MLKRDIIETFFDEIYSRPPRKNYPTEKRIYEHIDEIWYFDLADMIDYITSNNKDIRYIFIIIEKFSKNAWCVLLKTIIAQTIAQEFSNNPTTSKRSPLKIQSNRTAEFYTSMFQKNLERKNSHH